MTVAQMRSEMGNEEFIYWSRYYARRGQEQEMAAK